jgi:hypothetical protein
MQLFYHVKGGFSLCHWIVESATLAIFQELKVSAASAGN